MSTFEDMFFEDIVENPRQTLQQLSEYSQDPISLVTKAIQHTDDVIATKTITSLITLYAIPDYANDTQAISHIIRALTARYKTSILHVQGAILTSLKLLFEKDIRYDLKLDEESLRPLQIDALNQTNDYLLRRAFDWSILYYSPALRPIMENVIKHNDNIEYRAYAMLIELKHGNHEVLDGDLLLYILPKSALIWRTITLQFLPELNAEQYSEKLIEMAQTPISDREVKTIINKRLSEMAIELGSDSTVGKYLARLNSPVGHLSTILNTEIEHDIDHSSTWKIAVDQIAQGKANIKTVCEYIYRKYKVGTYRQHTDRLINDALASTDSPQRRKNIEDQYSVFTRNAEWQMKR